MSILDRFLPGRLWPPLAREHAVRVQEVPGAVTEDRQKNADYRTACARCRMMCRFASFAVPLTQRLKSSEFMRENLVFNVYQDNPAGRAGMTAVNLPPHPPAGPRRPRPGN